MNSWERLLTGYFLSEVQRMSSVWDWPEEPFSTPKKSIFGRWSSKKKKDFSSRQKILPEVRWELDHSENGLVLFIWMRAVTHSNKVDRNVWQTANGIAKKLRMDSVLLDEKLKGRFKFDSQEQRASTARNELSALFIEQPGSLSRRIRGQICLNKSKNYAVVT